MRKKVLLWVCAAAVAYGQGVTIPDGTKVRVRLEQAISSETADEGQTVELAVTENVKVDDVIVIPEGARVTGTITQAQAKRRMGRAGKLDFSVDRVRAVDGDWVPLRYTLTKKSGDSNATRNGIITAGVAVVFWPAAPLVLLAKGKDVTINKGVTFDVFTDSNHVTKFGPTKAQLAAVLPAQVPVAQSALVGAAQPDPTAAAAFASITITSPAPGAEIDIDGAFVGNTPTTLRLPAGAHNVTVRNGARTWQRILNVTAGSNVNISASFSTTQSARAVSN